MKRHLLIIAIFLLLGAIVNVAVAWGCAAFAVLDKQASFFVADRPGSSSVPFLVMVHRRSGFGLDQVVYPPTEALDGLRAGVQHTRPDLPRWALWPREPVDKTILYVAAGWPMVSLWSERRQGPVFPLSGALPLATVTSGCIEIPWPHRRDGTPYLLPLLPIWSGFAINAIFYAAILWLLIRGRRLLRLRRGLCPKCAYPMGESAVCTECGKPLPSRVRVA